MTGWRYPLPLLLGALLLLFGALIAGMGYSGVWELWNIPVMTPHFADLRTITGGSESYAMGLDPLVSNPGDPWGRAMSYPRIWQGLFLFGLDQGDTTLIGVWMITGFILALLLFGGRLPLFAAVMVMAVVASPAVLLGVERANNDLMVFLLLALALLAWQLEWLRSAFLLIFGATLLKLFPAFALLLFVGDRRPEVRRYLIFTLFAIACYGVMTLDDLLLINNNVLRGNYLSYGWQVLPGLLDELDPGGSGYGKYGLLALLALAGAAAWLARYLPVLEGGLPRGEAAALIVGGAIYVGTFLLGTNWDYRLMFLIFTLPALARLALLAEGTLSWLARAALLLILVSTWSIFPLAWLPGNGWMSAYLITDEVINWLLFGTLLWLLAWMLLRFEKEDLEEGEEAVPRRIPSEAGILIGLLMVWALAAWFNARLMGAIPGFDTPHFFPFSIFIPRFNVDGLAYTALLLGLIGIALRYHRCWSLGQIWLIGLGVLVIGNLIQGDFDRGFLQPLYVTNFQYYHDALAIRDPWLWLTSFNEQQPQLQIHARTHPPFAVLLHYPLLPDVMQRPVALALLFTLISSLAVPLFWATARAAGVEQDQARLLTLLLASVPAVNIYGAISLDGVILAFSLLFTFGLIKLWKRGWSLQGVVALVVGLLGVMAFTFLVAFHLALLAAVALWQWRREGARSLLAAAAVALGAAGLAMLLLWLVADYNHVQAFFTASRLENPDGFLALAEPTLYAMTRLEALLELLIFFSIPVAVVWLQGLWRGGWRMNGAGDVLSLLVLLILFAILLTGAFRTGEIARASLFVYPWLLLTLGRLDDSKLSRLVLLSGVQLALMQSLGYYFW